mmetsp:Transcript_1973/g.4860  ORF Transcript_1973/g.4860 Transcript_1973/m.4860 type:complete len:211 (+) Transcript_1973:4380-5012(+)
MKLNVQRPKQLAWSSRLICLLLLFIDDRASFSSLLFAFAAAADDVVCGASPTAAEVLLLLPSSSTDFMLPLLLELPASSARLAVEDGGVTVADTVLSLVPSSCMAPFLLAPSASLMTFSITSPPISRSLTASGMAISMPCPSEWLTSNSLWLASTLLSLASTSNSLWLASNSLSSTPKMTSSSTDLVSPCSSKCGAESFISVMSTTSSSA